jgi:hypothetical protein
MPEVGAGGKGGERNVESVGGPTVQVLDITTSNWLTTIAGWLAVQQDPLVPRVFFGSARLYHHVRGQRTEEDSGVVHPSLIELKICFKAALERNFDELIGKCARSSSNRPSV